MGWRVVRQLGLTLVYRYTDHIRFHGFTAFFQLELAKLAILRVQPGDLKGLFANQDFPGLGL